MWHLCYPLTLTLTLTRNEMRMKLRRRKKKITYNCYYLCVVCDDVIDKRLLRMCWIKSLTGCQLDLIPENHQNWILEWCAAQGLRQKGGLRWIKLESKSRKEVREIVQRGICVQSIKNSKFNCEHSQNNKPSSRFFDFVEGAAIFLRRYSKFSNYIRGYYWESLQKRADTMRYGYNWELQTRKKSLRCDFKGPKI